MIVSRLTVFLMLALVDAASRLSAHPGSGIFVDAQGQVYFTDTGQGVWKIDAKGKLTLIHTLAYHWMALDEKGHFASSTALGSFDRGEFERITPAGSIPTLLLSSDFPIAVGADGGLYYVPYDPQGPRLLIRRAPDAQRSVFARLPPDPSEKMLWVNGIVAGPDGSLYFTDNDAVRKVDRKGIVSTIRDAIQAPGCSADPLPDTPKLPYLRGLALASNGTIYAAANGCRSVIMIPSTGPIETVLQAERPWSPTGVAVSGKDVYVLEYLHTRGDDRKEWTPRVRKIDPNGKISTLATVSRQAR